MLIYLLNGLKINTVSWEKRGKKSKKKGPDIFACRVRCQLKFTDHQSSIVFHVLASRMVPFTSCFNRPYYLDSSSRLLLEERCRSGRTGQTRNLLYLSRYRGFESLPLRHTVWSLRSVSVKTYE